MEIIEKKIGWKAVMERPTGAELRIRRQANKTNGEPGCVSSRKKISRGAAETRRNGRRKWSDHRERNYAFADRRTKTNGEPGCVSSRKKISRGAAEDVREGLKISLRSLRSLRLIFLLRQGTAACRLIKGFQRGIGQGCV